ncbi:MAG: MAE_28990/MAE_18760 family HEPN-like nuclease [Motiliproteus sp.]
MDSIKDDLEIRVKEIDEYLDLLEFIDNSGGFLLDDEANDFLPSVLLKNTMTGAVKLLLYSLIESIMRESISAIHDQINDDEVSYDDLRSEIKKEIIRRAKNNSVGLERLIVDISPSISASIAAATFRSKNLFSGNIDRGEIKKMSEIYGFSTNSTYSETKHGSQLEPIKNHRNDLAHGNVSFSEVGRNYSVPEIRELAKTVIAYLETMIDNIESYIDDQGYLKIA